MIQKKYTYMYCTRDDVFALSLECDDRTPYALLHTLNTSDDRHV